MMNLDHNFHKSCSNGSSQSDPMSLEMINEELCEILTTGSIEKPPEKYAGRMGDLRSIEEIYKSIVVSAPTGSGKTVILELAIVRLVMKLEELNYNDDFKIVYMAPVKALCTERLMDWYGKFTKLGIPCIEVTGDTDSLDFSQLKSYRIIMTTPEKWDSMTRRWKDNKFLVQVVKLFIIDEVHLLNEDVRGPVLEAVVSRMKTIQESIAISHCEKKTASDDYNIGADWTVDSIFEESDNTKPKNLPINIRFIAISATIPNAEDIAEWLSTRDQAAACYKIGEEFRPVKLTKVVEGYPCKEGESLFKFDFCLNYKLRAIIERYCARKPTLIFCNTRKSVMMAADTLSKEILFEFSPVQKERFSRMAAQLSEKKLQALVLSGIGCHHAGFTANNRNIIEQMFRQGDLPVLITTSTLAMGVNLPAHLVIIKTTQHYMNGAYKEYEESTILQMMGRAGRPQFDTEGVAVIMTRNQDKDRYERLCGGRRCVESALHRHLTEHLNAEAALGTLPDLVAAADWIRSTFLYVRAVKNPAHYGYRGCNRDRVEKKLEELCLKSMNALARVGLLTMDADTRVTPTDAGYLMAAHCLDFETMKLILKIKGTETLSGLVFLLSDCHEFSDMVLRTSEKRCLNILNKNAKSPSCRFQLPGKIQSKSMKVNCLIQSVFGCLPIPDPSINQETLKIVRIGEHISKCIATYVTRSSSINSGQPIYKTVLNSTILAKCFAARLWENSSFVSRQLTGIGPTFASLLANANKTTFESIRLSNPRDLERIMNKLPPAGNLLLRQVVMLPTYEIAMKVEPGRKLSVCVLIKNHESLLNGGTTTTGDKHKISIIVGDSENNLLLNHSMHDFSLLHHPNAEITKIITAKCSSSHTVFAHCISNTWVGLDVQCEVKVKRSLTDEIPITLQRSIKNYLMKSDNQVITNDNDTLEQLDDDIDYDTCDVVGPSQESHKDAVPKKRPKPNATQKKNVKKSNTAESKVTPQAKGKNSKNIMDKISSFLNEIPLLPNMQTLSSENCYHKPLPRNLSKDIDIEFNNAEFSMIPKKNTVIQYTEKICDVQQSHGNTLNLSNNPKPQITTQHKIYNDPVESIKDKPKFSNENEYYDNSLTKLIDEPVHSQISFNNYKTLEKKIDCKRGWSDIDNSYEEWREKLGASTRTLNSMISSMSSQKQASYQQSGECIRVKNSSEYSNTLLNSKDYEMKRIQPVFDYACKMNYENDRYVALNDSCMKSPAYNKNRNLSDSINTYKFEKSYANTSTVDLTNDSDNSDDDKDFIIQPSMMMSQPYKHPYFGKVNDNSQYNLYVPCEPKIFDLTLEPNHNSIMNTNDNVQINMKDISDNVTQYNTKIHSNAYNTVQSFKDIIINTEKVLNYDNKEAPIVSNEESVSVGEKRKYHERRYTQLPITSFMKAKKCKLDEKIKVKSSPEKEKSFSIEPISEIKNNKNIIDIYSSILDKNISQPDVIAMNEVYHHKTLTLMDNVIQTSYLHSVDAQKEFLSSCKKKYVSWSSPLILPTMEITDNVIATSNVVALPSKIENISRAITQSNEIDSCTNIAMLDLLKKKTINFDSSSQDVNPSVQKIINRVNISTGRESSGINMTCNINIQININTTMSNSNVEYSNGHLSSSQPKIRYPAIDQGDQSVPSLSKTMVIAPMNTVTPLRETVLIEEIVEDDDTKVKPKLDDSVASNNITMDLEAKCNRYSKNYFENINEIKPKAIKSQVYSDINNWLQNSSHGVDCDLDTVTDIDVSHKHGCIFDEEVKIVSATREEIDKKHLNPPASVNQDPFSIEIADLLKKHSNQCNTQEENSQIGQELLDTSWEKDFEADDFPEQYNKTNDRMKTQADKLQTPPKISINDVFRYENDEILKNYQNFRDASNSQPNNLNNLSYCQNVFKSFSDQDDCLDVQSEINNSATNFGSEKKKFNRNLHSHNLQTQTESEELSEELTIDMMNPMSVLNLAYGRQNNVENDKGIDNIKKMVDSDFPEFYLSGELYNNNTNETLNKKTHTDSELYSKNNCNDSILSELDDNSILPRYKEFDNSSKDTMREPSLFEDKENRKLFFYNRMIYKSDETVLKAPSHGRWEKYLDPPGQNNEHELFDFGYRHLSSSSRVIDDNFTNPILPKTFHQVTEQISGKMKHSNRIMESI